jgi:hypothetical protein
MLQLLAKRSGLVFAFAVLAMGTFWAFSRGGDDFRVFYHAWGLVLAGRGSEIYRNSTDRFLYAPGFAWALAPLALVTPTVSLGVWCALKIAVVGWLIGTSAKLSRLDLGWACWGLLLVARPVLIDFQYGQVNLFILVACAWPVFRYYGLRGKPSRALDFVSWTLLGMVAVAKLFPLPLLLIPLVSLRTRGKSISLLGASIGAAFLLLLPLPWIGVHGFYGLYPQWTQALLSRGLPLESHNQSFAAFLHHFLSGEPTVIIAQHRRRMFFGEALLSIDQIQLLSAAWLAATTSVILALVLSAEALSFRRAAILLALLVVPSHLVWKPYFAMGLPLAIAVLASLAKKPNSTRIALIFCAFALMNLTGFDFVGLDRGAWLESSPAMLLAYLILCGSAMGARAA